MPTYTIRPAREDDAEAIVRVTQRSVEGLARDHYTPEQIEGWTRGRGAEYYKPAIAAGRMAVAETNGEVVAFVDAIPGELTRLFIVPEAAGHGLGRQLMDWGMKRARDGHTGKVKIEATRNAVGFYERFGFKVVGHGSFSRGAGNPPIEIVYMEEA